MAMFSRCERAAPPKIVIRTEDERHGGKAQAQRNSAQENETKQLLFPELGQDKMMTQPTYWRPFKSALLPSHVGKQRLRRIPEEEIERRRWFQGEASRVFHEAKEEASKARAKQRSEAVAETPAKSAPAAAITMTTARSTWRSDLGATTSSRPGEERAMLVELTENRPVTADIDTAVALILGQKELSSTSALKLARAYTYWDARAHLEKRQNVQVENRIIEPAGAHAQAAILEEKKCKEDRIRKAAIPYSSEVADNLQDARAARLKAQNKSRGLQAGAMFQGVTPSAP